MPTKFRGLISSLLVLCAICSASAVAQTKTEEKKAIASTTAERSKAMKELDSTWKNSKKWTLDYIDAMPEEAINFKPTPEIRSFAEQMLHLAYWNYGLAQWTAATPAHWSAGAARPACAHHRQSRPNHPMWCQRSTRAASHRARIPRCGSRSSCSG